MRAFNDNHITLSSCTSKEGRLARREMRGARGEKKEAEESGGGQRFSVVTNSNLSKHGEGELKRGEESRESGGR